MRIIRTLGYGQTYYQYDNGDDFNDTLESIDGIMADETNNVLEKLVIKLAKIIGISDKAGY